MKEFLIYRTYCNRITLPDYVTEHTAMAFMNDHDKWPDPNDGECVCEETEIVELKEK